MQKPTKEMQDFVDQYQELCKKTGYEIFAVPNFKMRDDGTYSFVINYQVVKTPTIKE
jgi:hypothetical protein